jgi:predicted SAM-dependent methyltransferase
MKPANGVWLNLGCGDDVMPEFINVDKKIFSESEKSKGDCKWLDLSKQNWPWKNEVDFIQAKDIIEHLPDKIDTMNKIWKALKPGGVVHIEVPTTDGQGAFQDPTHVSFWNERSFLYYESGNIYRERFAASYDICAAFKILHKEIIATIDGPKLRIHLEAVK